MNEPHKWVKSPPHPSGIPSRRKHVLRENMSKSAVMAGAAAGASYMNIRTLCSARFASTHHTLGIC